MTFKKLCLLICAASLGACSSTDEVAEQQAPQQNTQQTTVEATAPSLSPEQQLVQDLQARPDKYATSKKTLPNAVRKQVVNVLAMYHEEQFVNAKSSLSAILQQTDLSSAVYVLAGDIELALENAPEAKAHYQKALEVNTNNAKAANRLAKLLREEGEFEQALALYKQAIDAQATHAPSYRNRAVLLDLYLNKKTAALEDYQSYAALLNHKLEQHDDADKSAVKALKKEIKLAKRWTVDVSRQAKAQQKAQALAAKGE